MSRRNARGVSSGTRIGASVRTVPAARTERALRYDSARDADAPPDPRLDLRGVGGRGAVAAGAVLWVGNDSDDGGVEASDSGAAPDGVVADPTTTTLPPPTTTTTIGRRGQRATRHVRVRGRHPLRRRAARQAGRRIRRACSRRSRPCSARPTSRSRTSRPPSPKAARRSRRSSRSGRRRRRSPRCGRRHRRRDAWRTTTAWTTDPVGLAGLARRGRGSGFPIIGIGHNATRGVRAVPHDDQGSAHRRDRRDPGARRQPDHRRGPRPTRRAASRRRRTSPRLVAAVQAARATATPSSCSCTGASRSRRARAPTQQDAGAHAGGRRRRHRRRQPRAPAASARAGSDTRFVGYGLGNFAFYTPPGPGAETGVLTVTATGRDIDGYEFSPAVIRQGVPHPLER